MGARTTVEHVFHFHFRAIATFVSMPLHGCTYNCRTCFFIFFIIFLLLHNVIVGKSNFYDSGTGSLQYRSRTGRYCVCQGKGISFLSWEGGSHAVLFMVPFSHPSARSMAQALWLPF